ncbi:MAG: acyl-ACP--UDP-N-acetylglucosamine O-acyltransferase [bacterium]|nr:acyl-ACP--UDP-N-acetylglucosamine O-acyltransferase [bacterium]MDD3625085.1 acyl-ACP--UDP-N-acetylglucosamine O-acyltransferase [Proteiniphilum sp.]MDD3968354.1 acyl-ACP--UDP-N-acetylglucosamine O-acyltransferase [Proteiniphilum sp.]MDD4459519.1 acyl-ACP--UDP-N-acetylglucosamine O-acyltransferase [Proteiniphilum sp.]
MSTISSMAFVHPEAKLGENVIVEPFAYIDGNTEIGDGTRVMTQATVLSGARIGKNCIIFPHATISGIPQDLKFQGEETTAIIGDYTTIRECATINRGTASKGYTKVGSHCLIMAYSHVAHDCILHDYVILGNTTQLAGEIEIDDYAIVSGGTLAHQFTKIGPHVMIQGGSKIAKDIPPFVMVGREPISYVGLNIVGLRRRGFTSERINGIQEIYRTLYLSGYNISQAVERIEQDLPPSEDRDLILNFVRSSSRGIVRSNMEG